MTTATEEQTNEGTVDQRRAEEEAGFNSVEDEPTGPDTDTPATPTASPSPSEAPEVSPSAVTEPVKLAEISDDAFQKLLAKATEVDEIKAALEQRFNGLGGKIGGLERVLQELKGTGTGQKAEVSRDDLRELLEEFPEFGEKALTGLNRALSKLHVGSPTAPAIPSLTTESVEQMLADRDATRELKRLTKRMPDWATITGPPISAEHPTPTPYRQWLLTQPIEYQQEINSSVDAEDIAESITTFKDTLVPTKTETATAKPKGLTDRERQLRAAVPLKGAGSLSHTGTATDEESLLKQGFDEEAKRFS